MEKYFPKVNQNISMSKNQLCIVQINTYDSNKRCFKSAMKPEEKEEGSVTGLKCNDLGSIPKRMRLSVDLTQCNLEILPYTWSVIKKENLNLKYAKIFSKGIADNIFQKLEKEVVYYSGDLAKVKVYGKWHTIPRKQVAFGDTGLTYSFSGNCVPALPWDKCDMVKQLKEIVESITEHPFNFVLVNRYKDGSDYMGEHRDAEKDLDSKAPIASLSLGQVRDFIFRHKDARGSKAVRKMDPVTMRLEHGSLLLMEYPTNNFWYHQLPVRKNAPNVRLNLTFRQMVKKNK